MKHLTPDESVRDDVRRVRGIGPREAELLRGVGVESASALARSAPTLLVARVWHSGSQAGSYHVLPPAQRISEWVLRARTLSGAIPEHSRAHGRDRTAPSTTASKRGFER